MALPAKLPEPDAAETPAATDADLSHLAPTSRRWLHVFGLAFSVIIVGLSVLVLVRTVATVSWVDLRAAFAATGWNQIALAAMFACFSYLALTGYDALALRQLHLRVPYRRTALGSFTSYAISFTLGFPLITGGAVRYWIYSRSGVSPGKVASLTIIAGVTFWLGMGLVIGSALTFEPASIAEINRLKVWINLLIGAGVLGAVAAYLFYVSRKRRRIRIRGMTLELPGFGLTIAQMVLGVIDLCAASSVLYALLPVGHSMNYIDFIAVYVFGCVLGIASHIPGGIGPFEMTMLKSVTTPTQEGLLASLLLFRFIYYIIPFVLALALIGANEAVRRWTALREAMARAEEDGGNGSEKS